MKQHLRQSLQDIGHIPRLGRSTFAVWQRNFLYFRSTIVTSLFWACFEPVLYLLAVGYGLGSLVGDLGSMRYVDFFYPALLATTSMTVSFFESTYGSFTKMTHQKTFATILLSPVSADELVFGEILWGASKGFFSVCAVALVATLFGLAQTWLTFPALGILLINCWFFSAFGLLTCSVARNYDSFIYVTSGLIVPMSLFSGTYFPLERMPEIAQGLAYLLPLTYAVVPVRTLLTGEWQPHLFFHVGILILIAILTTNWAIARVKRKLIY